MIALQARSGELLILLALFGAIAGCTTAPEDAQLQALDGTWEITELEALGPRGDLTEALRSQYTEPPTLTIENGDPARYIVAGTRTSESDTLHIEGQVQEVRSNEIAFVSGFETDIVWTLDVRTGTRARLVSGPGVQGPAPLLRVLFPTLTWSDTDGARLQIERND
ncbi:MAG: hypothetical protein R6U20_12940 [Longimonas sp.]|uniref:hypothetical protein n=1 Tax=Longimonas sp. TaxID=2039626 RepID=UPI00397560B2